MMEPGNRTHPIDFSATVPAARPPSDFSIEQVGDDLVILDGETLQYHTLNGVAQSIWQACDGVSSVEAIALSINLPVEVVETTIAELGEASLLTTPANTWSVSMNRRRAAKLIAAGVVGAVGVPVVLSVTAPYAAQAASCGAGVTENTLCSAFAAGAVCGNYVCCFEYANCYQGIKRWRKSGNGYGPSPCTGGVCPAGGAPEAIQFDVTDASTYDEEIIKDDPYLGDEDGNVDLNAIQADSVEQSVEVEDVPATDIPVDEVQAAPVDDGANSDGSTDSSATDSDPVDTSSGEDAPTAAANG